MNNLLLFSGWICIAVPLWMIVFAIYYICGLLLKYISPAYKDKGAGDGFSRN